MFHNLQCYDIDPLTFEGHLLTLALIKVFWIGIVKCSCYTLLIIAVCFWTEFVNCSFYQLLDETSP